MNASKGTFRNAEVRETDISEGSQDAEGESAEGAET
jgi:hypothetical protein